MDKTVITKQELFDGPCKGGQRGACCRYAVFGGPSMEFRCAKHDAELAKTINLRVLMGLMLAQGDNCEGKRP